MRMMVKHEPKNCDGHWPALTGVLILGIVCLMLIAGFGSAAAAASDLGPVAVVASKDGKRLFVANTDARQVAVVDVASGKVTRVGKGVRQGFRLFCLLKTWCPSFPFDLRLADISRPLAFK